MGHLQSQCPGLANRAILHSWYDAFTQALRMKLTTCTDVCNKINNIFADIHGLCFIKKHLLMWLQESKIFWLRQRGNSQKSTMLPKNKSTVQVIFVDLKNISLLMVSLTIHWHTGHNYTEGLLIPTGYQYKDTHITCVVIVFILTLSPIIMQHAPL